MILQSCHICKCDPLASLLLPSLVGCPCSSAEEYSILYVLWNKCIFSNFQLSYLVEIRSHMFENILISFIQELCVTRMNAWNWHSSPVGEWIKWKKSFRQQQRRRQFAWTTDLFWVEKLTWAIDSNSRANTSITSKMVSFYPLLSPFSEWEQQDCWLTSTKQRPDIVFIFVKTYQMLNAHEVPNHLSISLIKT